jgi:hypothetical protein
MATAHGGTEAPIQNQETSSSSDPVEARLRKLSDLHAKGLISEAEYQQRKQEVLGSI